MGRILNFNSRNISASDIGLTLTDKGKHFCFSLPFKVEGRGIVVYEEPDKKGWYGYFVTLRAFDKLRNIHAELEQAFYQYDKRELAETILAREKCGRSK